MEFLEELDRKLFLLINGFHSPFADFLMWNASRKFHWLPFYLLLLYWVFKRYGLQIWKIALGTATLILVADQFSVNLFKDVFERYRPCHNLELKDTVHLVFNKCGGKYGFISSHASNTFAISSFLGMLLNKGKSMTAFFGMMLWAIFITYSRIYLGVHYPSDVFVGAVFGLSLGLSAYYVFQKFQLLNFGGR